MLHLEKTWQILYYSPSLTNKENFVNHTDCTMNMIINCLNFQVRRIPKLRLSIWISEFSAVTTINFVLLFSFNMFLQVYDVILRIHKSVIFALFFCSLGWKMKLSPREIEKLDLHNAGYLAQKRLARGLRLNYVETVALIATQVCFCSFLL